MTDRMLEYHAATAGLALPHHEGRFEVRETGPTARLVLRADEATVQLLSASMAVSLTQGPNRARAVGARAALRLGPDEWLLLAEADAAATLVQALAAAASGRPHALVDVSHRSAGLAVTGAWVTDVLAGACPLPLEADRFPVDRCTRTVFGKAGIMLWRRASDHFHLEAARSYLPYVIGLLNVECAALPEATPRPRAVGKRA